MIDIRVIPDLPNFLATIASVGVLFLILSRYLFGPVQELLAKRQEYITTGIRESEEAREEAERLRDEYNRKILSAKEESSSIISNARAFGEEIKSKAVNESKELARQELEKGKLDLENEKAKALKSMNDEIAEIAISAAEKVLREKMDSNQDKELVKSFILDLEADDE